jgi:uncharacterized protein YbjT (DUF2867 family)
MAYANDVYLVAGSLGDQGGAVARRLHAEGRRARALTRSMTSPAARKLRRLGIEVVFDDLDDAHVVRRDFDGVRSVFAALTPFDEGGRAAEYRRAANLADVAREWGVEHFVYSSVGDPERDRDLSSDALWEVERIVADRSLPLTLLRPGFFMENLVQFALRRSGSRSLLLRTPLDPSTRLQWIAVDDVGALAVTAIADPGLFGGGPVGLAGCELTVAESMDAVTRVLDLDVEYARISFEEVTKQGEHAYGMYRWCESHPHYTADIARLRALHPPLMTLADWLAAGHLRLSDLAA